jgi:hypothetical protein
MVAHGSEVKFAKMLMKPKYFKTESYWRWGGLFPYTYGIPVEEMANKAPPDPYDDGLSFAPPK